LADYACKHDRYTPEKTSYAVFFPILDLLGCSCEREDAALPVEVNNPRAIPFPPGSTVTPNDALAEIRAKYTRKVILFLRIVECSEPSEFFNVVVKPSNGFLVIPKVCSAQPSELEDREICGGFDLFERQISYPIYCLSGIPAFATARLKAFASDVYFTIKLLTFAISLSVCCAALSSSRWSEAVSYSRNSQSHVRLTSYNICFSPMKRLSGISTRSGTVARENGSRAKNNEMCAIPKAFIWRRCW